MKETNTGNSMPHHDSNTIKVLLIDDQAMIGEAIRRMFAPETDVEYRYITDAKLALKTVKEFKPTLILQDLVMPDVDGMDLLKEYKKEATSRRVPVVMLSSKDDVETKSMAFINGASDYLVKLPDAIELVARVRSHSKAYLSEIARDEARREVLKVIEEGQIAARENADFLAKMAEEERKRAKLILEHSKTLAHSSNLSSEEQLGVNGILKTAHSLLKMINEVQDIAAINNGHLDLSLQPLALTPLIEECINESRAAAKINEVTIVFNEIAGVNAWADRARLKQSILNLMSNAIKYNRKNGTVELSVQTHGISKLRINVKDTGRGIPYNKIPELFKPFNRLGLDSSEIDGVGISLALAKKTVEAMGGKLGLESKVDVGSTFWIELPQDAL